MAFDLPCVVISASCSCHDWLLQLWRCGLHPAAQQMSFPPHLPSLIPAEGNAAQAVQSVSTAEALIKIDPHKHACQHFPQTHTYAHTYHLHATPTQTHTHTHTHTHTCRNSHTHSHLHTHDTNYLRLSKQPVPWPSQPQ